jgi:DNA-binding LacI/PurR family transcriptional regulator
MPDITNPFFGEIYSYIRTSVMQRGYTSILYTTEDDLDILTEYLTGTSIRQLDGMILCFVDHDEAIATFIEDIQSEVPVVLLSWDVSNTSFNSVCIDVLEGIYKATSHLISLGHRKLAYIGDFEDNRISQAKFSGFIKALNDTNCKFNREYVCFGGDTFNTGYNAARKFVTNTVDHITAIVAEDDLLAIGAMKYLLQRGIKVPDEIALTGFDDILLSRVYEPSLSTVSLPKDQMGQEVVKLLLSKIEEPGAIKTQILLKTAFIARRSTDRGVPVDFSF